MRRFLVVFAMAALAVGALAPSATAGDPQGLTTRAGALSHDSYYTSAKSPSGRLAQSDQQLLSRTDSKIVSVMVKLDVDAIASYRGGVTNLRPTSPSATGHALNTNDVAVRAYGSYVTSQAQSVRKAALKSIPSIKFGQVFTVAYGGFGARLPANQAKNLLKLPGVAAVQADTDRASARRLQRPLHWRRRRLAQPWRLGPRRPGHHPGRHRHRHLARASDARRQRDPVSRRRPVCM